MLCVLLRAEISCFKQTARRIMAGVTVWYRANTNKVSKRESIDSYKFVPFMAERDVRGKLQTNLNISPSKKSTKMLKNGPLGIEKYTTRR